MKKRSFLVPLATLASAVATEQASAIATHEVAEPSTNPTNTLQADAQSENLSVRSGSAQFAFVLKREGQGQLMAYHTSHSSHSSHASHSSHTSGS
jgi:hypothetical protein